MSSKRNIICPCCLEIEEIKPPIIDVGQKYVYCDKCNSNCSYIYSNGETIYYHNTRNLEVKNE